MTRSTSRTLTGATLVAVLAACTTVAAATASSASSALKITNCTHAVTRPSSLVLACADANTLLRSLRWSSFGGATARARGNLEVNTCTPNCASGRFVRYPVIVRASGVLTCKRQLRVYRRIDLTFATRVPRSVTGLARRPLGCPT